MPKHNMLIQQSAWEGIRQIARYKIKTVGPKSAENFMKKILDTMRLLEETPLLGSLHHDGDLQRLGYRKLFCGEYVCIYKVVEGRAVVLRIFHGSESYKLRI